MMSFGALIRGNLMMNVLSNLDQVVTELESTVNLKRIKKLLYFVVYGKWEANDQKLSQVALTHLIRETLELNYSLDDLDQILKDICSKINKQVEYLAIAHQIIHHIAPLYPQVSAEASTSSTSFLNQTTQAELSEIEYSRIQTRLSNEDEFSNQINNDLFEVRLKLVQRTNPLRVKILILSALQHQVFNFTKPEWSALKKQRLDELLKKLFVSCPQKKDLENRLYKTAKHFKNKNETIQVASAIVKYLSPLYQENSTPSINNQVSQNNAGVNSDNSRDELATVENYLLNQVIQDPPGGDEAIAPDRPDENHGVSYPTSMNSPFPESEVLNVPDDQYPGQIYASEDDVTIPELQTGVSEHFQELSDFTENSGSQSVTPTKNSQPVSKFRKGLKITESLKYHLGLEAEIQTFVNSHVNRLMQEVETALSELEHLLDHRLEQEEMAKASSLKYNSMKEMISRVQGNTSKYLDLLNQMHEAEIQQLETFKPTPTTAANTAQSFQDKSAEKPEAKILALAKQGNTKAIAALINQEIKSLGLQALAAIKNDCLHVVLESEQEPNQKASIHLVRENILPLEIPSIAKVKVHWRPIGSKSPVWSYEFTYSVES